MKVIAILLLVAFSSVRKVNVTSIPANHVGFKSASVSSVIACEYCHDESDSFSKAAGDLACQFTMKALFVSAIAVKDILHSYFKLQVRIAWAMESFRSAIVSWTFSNSSVCPEWLGDPIDELGQIACKSLKQDESFAYFLLFFLWGCLVTSYFMNWVFGEVSFVYRSRGAGPWATKRPWKAIIEELIGLLYKIFGWLQHQAVIYTVGQVDDFTKGNDDSLTTASFSDDEEILSEQMEANIPITFVERTAEDEEEDLSAYSEAAIPLDPIETTSVSASNEELPSNHDVEAMMPTDLVEATSILAATVETDDSMACESHCTSLTNEEDAPKQLQSALHPKSSFQRETGICVDGIFMPCVESTPDPVTQEDREQLSVLLQRELNKFGIYNDLGEFMPFAEPSPLVATEQDREHLKMLLNRETKKVSLIRPIAKSLQLAASNQELESLQLAAWKRDSESSTIRSVTKSSLQLSASKQESESPPIQLTMPMSTRKSSKYGIDESIYESIYTTVLVRSKVPKEYAQWAEEMARTIESKSSLGSTGTDVAMS